MIRHTRSPALSGAVVIVAVALFGSSSATGAAPVASVTPESRPGPSASASPIIDRGPLLKETAQAFVTSAPATTLVALSGVGGLLLIAPYLRRKARLIA